MQVPDNSHRRVAGANMTPMIDVVFLLIIFFLVSSHLARQENRLPLELPKASTFDLVDLEKAPLTISVNDEANWLVGGEVVDVNRLRIVLAQLIANSGPGAAIRIRSDSAVQYRFVEPVLREAAIAGITDVAIAVHEK